MGRLAFMPQHINLSTTAIYIEAFFYSIFPKLHNTGFTVADIRSSHWRCSIKKTGLGNFEICKEKHLSQSCKPATFSKKDSRTYIFLWILLNFQEHLLWKISEWFQNFFCSEVSESGFDSTNKNHKFEQNMNMSSLFKVFSTNEIF